MNWYYAKNGHQNGPLPTEDMKDRIAMGEIAQSDLAWCEGMGDWLPVGEIPQLKVETAAREQIPAAPMAPADPSPYIAPSAAAPAQAPSRAMPGQPPSQGLAIGSLVCGILCLIGCCFWPVSGPLALVAVILGHIALSKIKADPVMNGGKGMAKAGLITGYLGLLAAVLIGGFAMWFATLSPEEIEEKIISKFPEAQREEFRQKMEAERAKQQQP